MIALYNGYAFTSNFGDLLLLKIFENWIKSDASSDIVYPLVPKSKLSQFRNYFTNAHTDLSNFKSWKALIYSGGGAFGEPERMRGKTFRGDWNKKFFRRNAFPAEWCIWNKIPYAIVGVEAGPLSNIFVKHEVKRMFARASVLSVRNLESEQFIRNTLGIGSNVTIAPDPALTLTKADIPEQALESVGRLLEPYREKILLGIHAPQRFLSETSQAQSLRAGLLSCLTSESDIVPVVFSDTGNSDRSAECCDRLASLIQHATGQKCLSIPFQGIWETVALISNLSAVLTTKLHVGMVGYALGVYCESFGTHQKTPRFYSQIGRSSQCTMLKDLEKNTVEEKVERAIQHARSKASIMDKNWQIIKNNALLHRKRVLSFLDLTATIQ